MAKIAQWIEADKLFERNKYSPIKPTIETYCAIKELGLETVAWEEYDASRLSLELKSSAKKFIESTKPCLFIYDPRTPGLRKNFLTNVNCPTKIAHWMEKNHEIIRFYNYLITSQITNPLDGFVGSARSDGKGRMLVTTLHYPKIYNQREVTCPTRDYTGYWNELAIDETGFDSLWSSSANWLQKKDVLELMDKYLGKEGYFEFVNGWSHGRRNTYTIGYEKGGLFSFDSQIHQIQLNEPSSRTIGRILLDGN